MLLVYVSYFYGFSYFEFTFINFFQSHNQAEQSSFTGTVRTNDSHNTIRRQHKVQVVEQQLVAIRLCYMLRLDNLVSQTRTVRNEDFQFFFLFLHIFIQQLIVRIQTGFTLCLTCLRSHTYPFQLTFQCLTTLAGSLFFHFHTLGLLFQPARVITLPWNTFTTVQLQNPSSHMVKEVTVVCYSNHRTFILLQVLFQPVDTFCIQVVGRLVQQQDVRFLQQQTTESYTTAFTSRQIFHRLVFGRTTQCVHRAFQLAVQIPCICSIDYILQLSLTGKQGIHFFGILVILRQTELIVYFFVFGKRIDYILYALHYYFFYSLGIVKVRLLSQITD